MRRTRYNHRKYYRKSENRSLIGKFQITTGMIITFRYPSKGDKRPLVFLMDTDEFASPSEKKSFSGINLNYLPIGELNRFFTKVSTRVGWELNPKTKLPKLDIWDEEDPGMRPNLIYKQFVKIQVLKKRDAWRTYKYKKTSTVEQINFDFTVSPLKEIIKEIKGYET